MRHRLLTVGAALFLGTSLAVVDGGERATPGASAGPARIAALVRQLGSDSFYEREAARKDIETIGAPALAALRVAIKAGDLETSRRAADLVRVIEEQALTGTILSPKKVHLKLKDTPVLQAVEKLARLSGYALRVDGDRTGLVDRTVTLDTGEVTFWEALDRLGAKAGIVEKLTIASLPNDDSQTDVAFEYGGLMALPTKKAMRRVIVPPLRIVRLPRGQPKPELPPSKEAPQPATPPLPVIAGQVILSPGATARQTVSYAGAVRLVIKSKSAMRPASANATRYYALVLEAVAEPRLLGFTVVGVPTVTRAADEHDQSLSFLIDPLPDAPPRFRDLEINAPGMECTPAVQVATRGVVVRLEHGAKRANRLKELAGSLTAQVLVPNSTLAVVDNILKAKGRTVDIKGGGRLHLDLIEKVPDPGAGASEYRLAYKLDNLPGGFNGGANLAVIRGGRALYINRGPLGNDGTVELFDARGQRLTQTQGAEYNQETSPDGQPVCTTATVQFRRDAGQDEPARFVLTGTYQPTIVVPFRFVNVPLP